MTLQCIISGGMLPAEPAGYAGLDRHALYESAVQSPKRRHRVPAVLLPALHWAAGGDGCSQLILRLLYHDW